MSDSFFGGRGGSNAGGFGNLFGGGMGGMSRGQGMNLGAGFNDMVEQVRGMFEQRSSAPRMGRGDVRAAVLALLLERPMHGYQIINEIDERSGGTWKPSPGSVYPTLQLLADEGLVAVDEADGRKTYALTDEGRFAAEAAGEKPAPWSSRESGRASALPKAGFELAQAATQVARSGSPEQVHEAVGILEDARRKLFAILARD